MIDGREIVFTRNIAIGHKVAAPISRPENKCTSVVPRLAPRKTRFQPELAKGLDATFAYDWSPADINRNNTMFTAGVRFKEPLPLRIHNTISLGYVRNSLSPQFLPPGMPSWKNEHAVEFNVLLEVGPFLFQPVIQYYANVGGGSHHAVVCGFRTKVEF